VRSSYITRAERVEIGAVGEIETLHLLPGDMYDGAAGDAFDTRDVRNRTPSAIPKSMMRTSLSCVSIMFRWLDVAMDHAARVRVVQRLPRT